MKSLTQTYKIHAPAERVWQALVDPKMIDGWGGGPAKMSDKKGRFSLWGGDVWGENLEADYQKRLVQHWFGGKWSQPSLVTFDLTEKDGVTTVVLTHKDIPDEEFNGIEQGWKEYYMGPIKDLVEKK